MKLATLTVGTLQTNCYILYQEDSGSAVVIDPSDEIELLQSMLRAHNLKVQAILLTHAHFDHGGAADRLRTETGAPVWAHPADRSLPSWLRYRLEWTDELYDGQKLCFDGMELEVLHTPGHTPGSVCFFCGDWLLSGDTLFAGSCGRTDLPGGDGAQMNASLCRLAALEKDWVVCPGHGEISGLRRERETNPCIRMALEQRESGDSSKTVCPDGKDDKQP
ncbi:MAG: MBL fold metallo-hydrolase [Oscillospiraceae bacterium]|nr:MBL fold metallo-hydrolase [Oscillospiraceae bacterium]